MIFYNKKSRILLIIDFLIYFITYYINISTENSYLTKTIFIFISASISVIVLYLTNVYHYILSERNIVFDIWKYVLAGIGSYFCYINFNLEKEYIIYTTFICTALVYGYRLVGKYIYNKDVDKNNIALYGCGELGAKMFSILKNAKKYKIVAIIDDNKKLKNRYIENVKIQSFNDFLQSPARHNVKDIIICINNINNKRKSELIEKLINNKFKCLVSKGVNQIFNEFGIDQFNPFTFEELLSRDIAEPNKPLLEKSVVHSNVLVTGAGGSIGSELCSQISDLNPNYLVMLDFSEIAIYELEKNITPKCSNIKYKFILGNILDSFLLKKIINKYNINIVFHAAAYKHVPIVEDNIIQSVKNNVLGTLNLLEVCEDSNEVKNFVLISSDKAVRPTNIMGATKRFCELLVQGKANFESNKINYSMVRFGNVFRSSGSVVPLLEMQIMKGGPLTITHPEVKRYFMSKIEAAQLVLQTASLAKNGSVYILDMGEQIKILDLAKKMLAAYYNKYNLYGSEDIEINFIGLRPGEKLYEELLIDPNSEVTTHNKIYCAQESYIEWIELEQIIKNLKLSVKEFDKKNVIKILKMYVTGFKY